MSWLFSQALVAEYLGENSLDGEQSAPLSVMPTPHKFWRSDKPMEFSGLSRFGLTCAVLTESRGEELLTLFLAAFPVKTFPAQEKAQDLTESAADCGQSLPGLLAKYDPDTHSLRTAQCSLFGDLTECYVTLPRWGLMRDGALYLPPTVALPMKESGCGLSLPTPCTVDTGSYFNKSNSPGARLRPTLGAMAKHNLWPTPTVCGNHNKKGLSKTSGDGLSTAVKKWPTPQASDNRDRGNLGSGAIQRRREKGKQMMLSQSVSDISGALNPQWVEWLMGWPIGWTDLKPLETDKCRFVRLKHFDYLANSDETKPNYDRPQD